MSVQITRVGNAVLSYKPNNQEEQDWLTWTKMDKSYEMTRWLIGQYRDRGNATQIERKFALIIRNIIAKIYRGLAVPAHFQMSYVGVLCPTIIPEPYRGSIFAQARWLLTTGRYHPTEDVSKRINQNEKVIMVRDLLDGAVLPGVRDLRAAKSATVRSMVEGLWNPELPKEGVVFDPFTLSVLGDALEEAGCTDAAILNHCRNGKYHFPGCWVIDVILGLEYGDNPNTEAIKARIRGGQSVQQTTGPQILLDGGVGTPEGEDD